MGNDLIPYIQSLLAEFGLEIAHIYVVNKPGQSYAEMAAEGVPKRVQALLQLGTLELWTVYSLLAFVQTIDRSGDWLICTPLLSAPLIAAGFGMLPFGAAGANNIITTLYDALRPSAQRHILRIICAAPRANDRAPTIAYL